MTDQQVELLQDLMFRTVPGDLADAEDALRADMKAAHAKANKAAKAEIAEVIKRHGGTLKSIDNPTATMEDLFLNIVRESEARPGARRVSGSGPSPESGAEESAADSSGSDQGESGQ